MSMGWEYSSDEITKPGVKTLVANYERMNVNSSVEANQSPKKEETGRRGHYPPYSDSTVDKQSFSRTETENTKRFLPEPPKSNDGHTLTMNQSRSLPEPPKSNDGHTWTKNQSRSFPEPPKSNNRETGTINQLRDVSPKDMEIFQHPMCLISTKSTENKNDEETHLVLQMEQKAFDQLEMINLPMVVVAVVGLYRSGKSYLMNSIAPLPTESEGFAIGHTLQSKTKGIWAWCKKHPEMSDTVLLLLDTEGLGDIEKVDPSHDNNIFTLATLLCNCLVYNMKGAFNSEDLSKLTFITEMVNNIRFRNKTSEDNEFLNLILPDFVLCFRDFSLEPEINGKNLTENEYLEHCLDTTKKTESPLNRQRETIKKYFKNRACFLLPLPGDGDVLKKLDTLSSCDLSGKFIKALNRFVTHIYRLKPKELLASKAINGQMFVNLADRYVTAINRDETLDVDRAISDTAEKENAKVQMNAIKIFREYMEHITLPVSDFFRGTKYTEAQQSALRYLRKNTVHDKAGEYEQQAQIQMDKDWMDLKEINKKKVRELCHEKLQEIYRKKLKEKIESKQYQVVGGHKMFRFDVQKLREEYRNSLMDFAENEISSTWVEFESNMNDTEVQIIQADENLSQKQKEEEQRLYQAKIKQLLEKQQKQQQNALEKLKHDMEVHQTKLLEDRQKQLAIEKERYEDLVKQKLENEAKEKELERFRKEHKERENQGFFQKAWNSIKNFFS